MKQCVFFSISNPLFINKDDLPIVSSLQTFNLQILTHCDIHSLGLILYCMPNLHELNFTFIMEHRAIPFNDVLLNGNIWQNLLTIHVPHLNKFDIHISLMREELFDLNRFLIRFDVLSHNMMVGIWLPVNGKHFTKHVSGGNDVVYLLADPMTFLLFFI